MNYLLKIIFSLVFGLIIFFFGLALSEKGLKKSAGSNLKNILRLFSSNLLSGIITGIFITAIIQSSSAVSVMTIGFVNSGIMTFYQGLGVIIGSNIGTTVTIHILSFKIPYIEWFLGIIGIVLLSIGSYKKQTAWKYSGLILLGFGLIFLGLTILQFAVAPLQYHPKVMGWLMNFAVQPLLGIIAGMGFTALIQSSSATSGLVLTIANQGMITLKGAIGVIWGSNIGTCITALIAGIRVNKTARNIAYFHVIFNIFGVLIFIPFLDYFTRVVADLSSDLGKQISIAHTLFNILTAIVIIPFIRLLANFLERL